jgi:hypothetical protein
MTNGQYTLADFTNMNRVLSARITALEKAVAFNPNNVTIGGYLNVQPNNTNPGNLAVSSNALISGALQVNKSATINQNLNVGGTLAVSGGITFNNLNVNTLTTNTINNTGAITAATFAGNGAALTGVLDNTKLPLNGGTLTGSLTVSGGNIISGNGSGLTNINDINKLPLAGGTLTGTLNMGANAINSTGTITANSFAGSGSLLTGITATPSSTFLSVDQGAGTYTPPYNVTKYTTVLFQFTNSCTLDLLNFSTDPLIFPDGARYFQIIKSSNSVVGYTVTINAPAGYTFYTPTSTAAFTPYIMGPTVFCATLVIWSNGISNFRIFVTNIS